MLECVGLKKKKKKKTRFKFFNETKTKKTWIDYLVSFEIRK